MTDKIKRIASEDDPRRCQGVRPLGQCQNIRMEGSNFCAACGGNSGQQKLKSENLRNFRLTRWQSQVNRMTDSDAIKSLKEEIGILRMMLEERLNMCHDASELLMYSGAISDLVLKIEKVVGTCHKIDSSLGEMLSRSELLEYARKMISILTEEIQDKELLDKVANRLVDVLETKNDN